MEDLDTSSILTKLKAMTNEICIMEEKAENSAEVEYESRENESSMNSSKR